MMNKRPKVRRGKASRASASGSRRPHPAGPSRTDCRRSRLADPEEFTVAGIRIGNLIEALIGLLDQAAGDPDMEDGDLDRCTAGEDGPIADARLDSLWQNVA